MKKNMYKIFGAAAIIGLFLISSIASTSLAAKAKDAKSYGPVMESRELEPVDPAEPTIGLFFPDLVITDMEAIKCAGVGQAKVRVIAKNTGRTIFLPQLVVLNVYVNGIDYSEDIPHWNLWLRGQEKEFETSTFTWGVGYPRRRVTSTIDYEDSIYEGLLGEFNNVESELLKP